MDEINQECEKQKFKFGKVSSRSAIVLVLCCLGSFCDGSLFSILAPFYPQLAASKGTSTTNVGIIFAVFELTSFILALIYGKYINHIGPKFLYSSGLVLCATSTILFGLLDRSPPGITFIALSIACRCVQAVGFMADIVATFSIVSNEFPNHIATIFGTIEGMQCLGLMVGPTIGGALYEVGGFALPFYTLGSLIAVIGVCVILVLPTPEHATVPSKKSAVTLLKCPYVLLPLLSVATFAMTMAYLSPTLATHVEKFGLTPFYIGLLFVIAPSCHAVMSPIWGFINDRKSLQVPMTVTGNIGCCVALLLIGPSPWLPFLPFKLWLLIVGLMLYGFNGSCILSSAVKSLLKGALDRGYEDNLETYGILSGMYNAAFSFGGVLGPFLGGILVEHIGFGNAASLIACTHIILATAYTSVFLKKAATK